MTDRADIPQGPIQPCPSVADVLREYRELDLPSSSVGMQPPDADATLWLLSEVSSLLGHAIEASRSAAWRQSQHEKAVSRAELAKSTTTRRGKKLEAAA